MHTSHQRESCCHLFPKVHTHNQCHHDFEENTIHQIIKHKGFQRGYFFFLGLSSYHCASVTISVVPQLSLTWTIFSLWSLHTRSAAQYKLFWKCLWCGLPVITLLPLSKYFLLPIQLPLCASSSSLSFSFSAFLHHRPPCSLFLFCVGSVQAPAIPCILHAVIHARRASKNCHAHIFLCLYLIIGSVTGDIFPDNTFEGGEPSWLNRGDLSIPHHIEATVLALPLTEMNEFNISRFWSTDDLLIWLSVSLLH